MRSFHPHPPAIINDIEKPQKSEAHSRLMLLTYFIQVRRVCIGLVCLPELLLLWQISRQHPRRVRRRASYENRSRRRFMRTRAGVPQVGTRSVQNVVRGLLSRSQRNVGSVNVFEERNVNKGEHQVRRQLDMSDSISQIIIAHFAGFKPWRIPWTFRWVRCWANITTKSSNRAGWRINRLICMAERRRRDQRSWWKSL